MITSGIVPFESHGITLFENGLVFHENHYLYLGRCHLVR